MNEARCATHPTNLSIGPCARCGKFVCELCVVRKEGIYCTECGAMAMAARVPTEWEQRAELGPLQGMWRTWKRSVFHPNLFFASMKPDGDIKDALLYAWTLLAFGLVPNLLFQALNYEQIKQSLTMINGQKVPEWMTHISRWEFGAVMAIAPLLLFPLTFFMSAGLTHLGCMMFSANKHGFRATARAVAYAQGPSLAASVPMVGGMAGLYVLVMTVFGIARGQEVSGGRAAAAVLVPTFVLACCLGTAISAAVIQMILAHR